jgi:rhamnosyltransferase
MVEVAVVTLFNPKEEVIDNIKSYQPYIKELLIIDNSPSLSTSIASIEENFSNTILLSSSTNLGISKSLNLALDYAKSKNYSWLLTMDQDSYFDKVEIEKFFSLFRQVRKKDLAIFSPLHNKAFLKEGKTYNSKELFVLTSGNIINVQKAFSIGGFNEKLFIDEVDHEFCLRLKKRGYIIFQNQNSYLNHTLGEKHGNLNVNLYPSSRIYYMVRNYLYIRKKYKREMPLFFEKRDIYLLKFFLKQFYFSKKRIKYIFMLYRGIKDYKNSKMGYQVIL